MRRFRVAVTVFVATLLASVCHAKQPTWVEVRSPNFIVVSNAGEKQARKAAIQFEEIRAVFRQSLTVASNHPSPVVTVLAARDEGSMRELLPEYWSKGHAHPAGLFASRLNQYFAAVQLDAPGANPYETFYHEYYHTISVPYFPEIPVWLAEGLAELFGHTTIEEHYVSMGEPDGLLLQELRNSALIPLSTLFKVDESSPYYNEANKTSIFYAESWALTHYFMIGDRSAHRPALSAYLSALENGKPSEQAAAIAFGDLKKLESDLQIYIHNASYYHWKIPRKDDVEKDTKFRLLSEAEADAYIGGFFAVRGDAKNSVAMLQQALQTDPNLALAHEYMSMAEFLKGDRQSALESVTKAITIDPRNWFTRYMRAFLATSGSGMMVQDSQVEEDLRQAIALSPEFIPPYGLLASYLSSQRRNLPEALTFAQKAATSEPGVSYYRLSLANVFAAMNKFDSAAAAAAQARALARNDTEKANVDSFLGYLQQARNYQEQLSEFNAQNAADREVEDSKVSGGGTPTGAKASNEPPAFAKRAASAGLQMQASINVLSDTGGVDLTPYLKDVMEAMRKNLTAHMLTMAVNRQRDLSVEFTIMKDGTISGLKISSASGDTELDKTTRDSVSASSPLPALPRTFKGQYVQLHLGVSYAPQPGS